MPRFYFHTHDGMRAFNDEDGVDLPSVDHAEREAMGLVRDLVDTAAPLLSRTVVATVCDITGAAVVQATLSITSERFNR